MIAGKKLYLSNVKKNSNLDDWVHVNSTEGSQMQNKKKSV